MADILVVAESVGGGKHPATLEACHVAEQLASAWGWGWASVERPATPLGLDAFAHSLAAFVSGARVVLMGGTATGKDVMARVAGHLRLPLAQDCVDLRADGGSLMSTRALYGGKVLADVRLEAQPALVTLRPRTQPRIAADALGASQPLPILDYVPRVQTSRQEGRAGRQLDVAEADIVVSGGRGMQGPEHWHLLEDLVSALGPRATLACSRPVSDEGWRPRSEHVGQTGRAIAPEVYVACGISGAIQHMAGLGTSTRIVAINKDPNAPIFKVAEYGIVGDVFEVVPWLTEQVRTLESKQA